LLTIGYSRDRYGTRSKYTRIGYYITLIAAVVQGYLWFAHFQDTTDEYTQYFTYIALYECLFAIAGLLFYDPLNHRGFHLRKKKIGYTPLSAWLLVRVIVIMGGLFVIQFSVQFIPMTIKDYEISLAVIFAGPCEENFFRGILISIVILTFSKYSYKFRLFGKEISLLVIFGIFLSSIAFAMLHVNYYGDIRLLLGTLLCGLWLGFTYWRWEDLTANIMAHFLLNLIVVLQSFWLVNF
jgi:membrane protease YdiL (CAAX protease family)